LPSVSNFPELLRTRQQTVTCLVTESLNYTKEANKPTIYCLTQENAVVGYRSQTWDGRLSLQKTTSKVNFKLHSQ